MYDWYNMLLLDDVLHEKLERLGKSIWFKRGWTLRELLALPSVEFYDQYMLAGLHPISRWQPYQTAA